MAKTRTPLKKLLALTLALSMTMGLLNLTAFAADGDEALTVEAESTLDLSQQTGGEAIYVDADPADVVSGYTWESSDTNIATVDGDGLVTGVAAGTVAITRSNYVYLWTDPDDILPDDYYELDEVTDSHDPNLTPMKHTVSWDVTVTAKEEDTPKVPVHEDIVYTCVGSLYMTINGKQALTVSSDYRTDDSTLFDSYAKWYTDSDKFTVKAGLWGDSAAPKGVSAGTGTLYHTWYTNTKYEGTEYLCVENTDPATSSQFAYACTEAWIVEVAAEHTWNEDELKITKEPTCTTTGRGNATCTHCSATIFDIVIPALGHVSTTDPEVTTQPTCMEEGVLSYTCDRCGQTYTETLPALHNTLSNGDSCPQCGQVLFSWDEDTKTLTISASVPAYSQTDYTTRPYQQYADVAERIVIDDMADGVATEGGLQLGAFAFASFTAVKAIGPADTPEGTAIVDVASVGMSAFRSIKTIQNYIFTENVQKIGTCLTYCGDLDYVEINHIPDRFMPNDIALVGTVNFKHMRINDLDGTLGYPNLGTNIDDIQELTLAVKEIDFSFYSPDLEALTVEAAEKIPAHWIESPCTRLKTIVIGDGVGEVADAAFQDLFSVESLSISETTKLGYSNIFAKFPDLVARMESILAGKFVLGSVEQDDQLTVDSGWDDSHVGSANTTSVPGTQVTKAARWTDEDKTHAEVQLQFSYTEAPGKDFLFVVDYSSSMAEIGNSALDSDSKFTSMQSKLLDVTGKLLDADNGYNNHVAIISFSDQIKNTLGFTDNAAAVEDFIRISSREVTDENANPYGNTNFSLALQEAKAVLDAHTGENDTVVIFISDGIPNRDLAGNSMSIATLMPEISGLADAIKSSGTEIIGVLQSLSSEDGDKAALYAQVMEAVASDGLCFTSYDTDGFSKAVNDSIGAAFARYVLTDVVNITDFTYAGGYKITAEGKNVTDEFDVSYDAKTNTLTWDLTGAMPYTKYVLTFQETLKPDGSGKYPYGDFDTNEGNAVVTAGATDVNTVATPVLSREDIVTPPVTTYDLTVRYLEEGSQAVLADPYTASLVKGDPYDVTVLSHKEIEGYTLTQITGDPVTGVMDGKKEIIVWYTEDDTPVVTPPEDDTPTTIPGDDDEPSTDLPDEDTPTTELPEEETPTTDLPEEETPTTEQPVEETPDEDPAELPEEDVPMAEAPETGDTSLLWLAAAALSGSGLAWLALSERKRREQE